MLVSVYAFLGVLGIVTSLGTFYTGFDMDMRLIFSLFSMFVWGIWGFSSFEVQVITDSGGVVSQSYLPLVMIGFAVSFVMLLFTVRNGFDMAKDVLPTGQG